MHRQGDRLLDVVVVGAAKPVWPWPGWATGYHSDYGWIHVPEVVREGHVVRRRLPG